ncbi:MAG TPA: hypothetical protein VHP36_09570 [Chitinispirillaceae bacterium]|nr:hypothetical protein [Chitinispirillaceae bacterium]
MTEIDRMALAEKAAKVKLLVIGVDGVLTDAGMYFNDNGDYLRKFNRRDGMGIQLLKSHDIKSAIVSSMQSRIVEIWGKMFEVDFIRLGVTDKIHEIEKLKIRCGLKMEQIAYISDDIDELEIIQAVGFGVTVADGMSSNKKYSSFVTKRCGGQGAVREVVEIILGCQTVIQDQIGG